MTDRILSHRGFLAAALLIFLALLAVRTWAGYSSYGLFRAIGVDFGDYWGQSVAFRLDGPAAIYDLRAVTERMQTLRPYTADPAEPLVAVTTPYPPLFAWLFIPFTWPSPPVGFALWTALNLGGALWLARRIAQIIPRLGWGLAFLLLLASFPVFWGLVNGQPVLLLGCALDECYLALREGRDLKAGLWLSCLLVKPQYALLLGPLLIFKRRWMAVAGALIGAGAILGGSLLVAGIPTLLAYPSSIAFQSSVSGYATTAVAVMSNWRALVMRLLPGATDSLALMLTLLLGLLTVIWLLPLWRGSWAPRDSTFPAKVTALLLASILVNYHSHAHGAALLALPAAAAAADPETSKWTRGALLGGFFLPSLYWLLLTLPTPFWAGVFPVFTFLLLLAYALLVLEFSFRRVTRRDALNSPVGSPSAGILPSTVDNA